MKKFLKYIFVAAIALTCSLWYVVIDNFEKNEQAFGEEEHEFGEDSPEGFAQYIRYITGTPDGNNKSYKINYRLKEYYRALRPTNFKSTKAKLNWIERGPGNVGGRTRSLLIHPSDTTNSTWFAASVSGIRWVY